MLTKEMLQAMSPKTVFAKGETTNDPEGIYMTDHRRGDKLIWLAKRGEIHDWTVYLTWAENGYDYCERVGDKTNSEANIRKLVPCNDEAYHLYRK